ncbi:MAG: VOC family protein [Pseudomonadota bacterium]
MSVRRIVANVATADPERARAFYADVLGLAVAMDMGWIVTFVAASQSAPQVSFATHGGSGTTVPDLSVEVDDVDAVYERAVAAGLDITYGPVDEPWGVRRFYVRDPFGKIVNVLSHGDPRQVGTPPVGS